MVDYRDGQVYSSSTAAKAAGALKVDTAWWLQKDEGERGKSLEMAGLRLVNTSMLRQQANLRHARLYENVDVTSLTGGGFASDTVTQVLARSGIVTLNVISSCIDTLTAKIAKNKPRPNFLTTGGNWLQQQKARRLTKFTDGMFYETKVYEKAKRVFVDACTFGTGFLQIFQNDDGRLDCERVSINEIFVDEVDGQDGCPQQMIRRKYVQREVLCRMFPEYAEAIMRVPEPKGLDHIHDSTADMVEVWEGWRLPTGPKSGDGVHCICINGAELFCEKWKVRRFPFVVFRYKPRLRGYWGKGVCESLVGIQIELNRLMTSVSEQLRRKGRGRIFVQTGSKVNPNQLTNAIADIVYYTGTPPIVDSNNSVAQEEFLQIDRLYQKAFQEVGISELSAAAKKPSGLDAAVALREYSDIESERFAIIHQAWENFFLDYAETCLDLIAEQFGSRSYKIRTPSKRYIIEVDWLDIDLDRDSYVMQMFPVSSLPATPAARYQKVREMMVDGFVDKPVAQRLLEFPDVDAESNLGNAAIDDVDSTISKILDEEEPQMTSVEIYQNAQLMISRATAAYLYAKHHGADEERLDMLRQLIDQATAVIAPPNQAGGQALLPPPVPMMTPGAPDVGIPPAAPGPVPPAGPEQPPVA